MKKPIVPVSEPVTASPVAAPPVSAPRGLGPQVSAMAGAGAAGGIGKQVSAMAKAMPKPVQAKVPLAPVPPVKVKPLTRRTSNGYMRINK